MASGTSRQLAVSITPPMLSTTSAFFFRAWNAAATSWISAFSTAVSSKSPSRARSRNSPELRPMVTSAEVGLLRQPGDLVGRDRHLGQRRPAA